MKTSIRALLAVLLLALYAPFSFAQIPATPYTGYFTTSTYGSTWQMPNLTVYGANNLQLLADVACPVAGKAFAAYYGYQYLGWTSYSSANNPRRMTCNVTVDNGTSTSTGGIQFLYSYITSAGYYCPANSTLDGTNCVCDSGYTELNGSCVVQTTCNFPFVLDPVTNGCFQPCLDSANDLASSSEYVTLDGDYSAMTGAQLYALIGTQMHTNLPNPDGHVCDAVGTVSSCYKLGGSLTCLVNNITFTGQRETAVPSVTIGDQAEKQGLDNGVCYAEMGGNRVSVPCDGVAKSTTDTKTDATGTTTTTGATSTTKNPDGSTTTTTSRTTTNPDGSTTTTTTTCTDGQCTSSSVTKDPQGNTTEQRDQDKPKAEFCQENPTDPACAVSGGSSYQAGNCESVPVCQGDAIQCAIAKLQHEQKCALIGDGNSELFGIGESAIAGGDVPGDHPGANPETTTFALSSLLNQDNEIAASCPPDQVFTVAGVSLSIPFSTLCPHLAMLGTIVHAFSLLAAAGIVFRG